MIQSHLIGATVPYRTVVDCRVLVVTHRPKTTIPFRLFLIQDPFLEDMLDPVQPLLLDTGLEGVCCIFVLLLLLLLLRVTTVLLLARRPTIRLHTSFSSTHSTFVSVLLSHSVASFSMFLPLAGPLVPVPTCCSCPS